MLNFAARVQKNQGRSESDPESELSKYFSIRNDLLKKQPVFMLHKAAPHLSLSSPKKPGPKHHS